jgi:hypothetical protein
MVQYYDTEKNCENPKIAIICNDDVEEFFGLHVLKKNGNRIFDISKSSIPERYDYDVRIIGRAPWGENYNRTVEVKNDIISKRTGNAAFEWKCKGKPSGLSVTKAFYWLHIVRHNGQFMFLIDTVDNIKRLVRELKHKTVSNAGNTDLYTEVDLVKIDLLLEKIKKVWWTIDNPTDDESLLRAVEKMPEFIDWDLQNIF